MRSLLWVALCVASLPVQAQSLSAPIVISPAVPQPATSMPPGVGVGGDPGTSVAYARADHTHATSVQRARVAVSGSSGIVTWTYAAPYAAGVVPAVSGTAEVASGTTRAWTVDVYGTPTSTQAQFIVFAPATVSVGALGVAVNVTTPVAPAGTYIHVQAAKPTQ